MMQSRIIKLWLLSVAIVYAIYMATTTELSATNQSQSSPLAPPLPNPTTVNVNVYHQCVGDPRNGTITPNIPLETYVKRVLPNEWEPYWDAEALDAGAIAVRSWVLSPPPRSNCQYPFGNGVCYYLAWNCGQNYQPGTEQPETNASVDRTRYQFLSYEDSNFPAEAVNTQYRADTGNPTRSWVNAGSGYPYLKAVADPVATSSTIGPGASQLGSQRWISGVTLVTGTKLSVQWSHYTQILTHYYTGIHVRDGNNSNAILTPNARWVPLEIDWKTAGNQPPQLYHGNSYPIRVRVQNSGTGNWNCTYPFFTYNLRYQWRRAGQVHTALDTSQSLCTLARGDNQWVDLTLRNIPNWGPGAYTLRLDMATSNATGATCSDIQPAASTNELWFGDDCGWYPNEVAFCIDGPCRTYLPYLKK